MCIIIAKKFNSKYPTKEVLKNCFKNNSDGAGFSYCQKGEKKVTIKKGFMKFDDFFNEYSKVTKNVNFNEIQILYHFRITTSGGTSKENCHPFPVTDQKKLLTSQFVKTPIAVAMNGIIDCSVTDKTLSDTMEFIKRDIFLHYSLNRNFYKNKQYANFLDEVGAKWVFMDIRNIYLFGEFIDDKGLLYSNTSYKYSSRYSYYRSGYYGDYDYTYTPVEYKSGKQKYKSNLLDKTRKLADCTVKPVELVDFEGFVKNSNGDYCYIGCKENVLMSFGEELYLFDNGKYYYLPDLMIDYSM